MKPVLTGHQPDQMRAMVQGMLQEGERRDFFAKFNDKPVARWAGLDYVLIGAGCLLLGLGLGLLVG